jgi:hypothetical protein
VTGPHEFTSPEVLERELHRLAGLLQGIALDGRIRPADVDGLRKW